MSKYKEEILENKLIQEIIKKLNLNENQIESGIPIFRRIIDESKIYDQLDYRTTVAIYDENNVISIIEPNGNLRKELIRSKYHLLSEISYLDSNIEFSKKSVDEKENISNKFFWSIKDANNNDRTKLKDWFRTFYYNLNQRDTITNKEKLKGFYLYGSFGLGKTSFLSALANYLIYLKRTVVYIKLSDLIVELKKCFDKKNKLFGEIISTIKQVEFLLIDDLGGEKMSEWFLVDVLYPILDFRFLNGKMTCFTSNFDFKHLKETYSKNNTIDNFSINRLINRLFSMSKPILIKGKDLKEVLL